MKGLSSNLIADLNKDYDAGVFFEAIIVTRDMDAVPQVKDYFCNFQRPFVYLGNEYRPEPMEWDASFSLSKSMELPVIKINLANIGAVVDGYLHDPAVKVRRNDLVQQILHISNTGVITEYDRDVLQIQVISGNSGAGTATIFAGWNMRLDDRVPRGTIETNEFPGIRGDAIRKGV